MKTGKNYDVRFLDSVERAHRLGLSVPGIADNGRRYITPDLIEKIPYAIASSIGPLTRQQVVGQCFYVHRVIKKPLENLFGTELFFTIGYIELAGKSMFKHDENTLRNLLRTGITNPQMNLHAWLTFPSMEIIDFSLSATFLDVNEGPQDSYGILASHADELKGSLRYYPTLVGDDFLYRIGAIASAFVL